MLAYSSILGWGIFGWMNKWLVIPIFNWLDGWGWNYGIIILVLTIVIKLLLMPLTVIPVALPPAIWA